MAEYRGYLTINSERNAWVKGPSVYKLAPDTIEVTSVSHGVSRSYDPAHGTPRGDRQHMEFVITKEVDMATPTLNEMCCNGERILDMTLQYYIQTGASPDPVPFYSWKLTDAYVTNVSVSGSSAEDLAETVSFSYQQIEWHHYAHRAPDGVKELPDMIQVDSWGGLAG